MVRIAVLCAKSPYYSEMNTEKRHGNRTRVAIAVSPLLRAALRVRLTYVVHAVPKEEGKMLGRRG